MAPFPFSPFQPGSFPVLFALFSFVLFPFFFFFFLFFYFIFLFVFFE